MTPEEIAAKAAADKLAADKAAADQAAADEKAAADKAAADKAAADAANQDNAANAERRLLKKAQDDLAAANKKLQDIEDAKLSETDRLKKEAADSKKAAEDALLENLRLRHGKDLPDEALEFLTGTDEETIKAQAEKLAKVYQPGEAGTRTRPSGNQQPSYNDQLTAAQKAGNTREVIRLKREKAFGGA